MSARTGSFDGVPVACLPLGLHGRGRLRDLACRRPTPSAVAERAARRAGGEADRARRARFAAPRSRPLPLRPRHRSRPPPVEAGLAWSIQKRRRDGGRLSGRRAHPSANSQMARRASASASCSTARRRRAKAPRSSTADGGDRRHASRPAASGPRSGADRHGLCRRPPTPRRERRLNLMVRGKPLPARVAPCPSFRTVITAADRPSTYRGGSA